jgi:hypothetical protein
VIIDIINLKIIIKKNIYIYIKLPIRYKNTIFISDNYIIIYILLNFSKSDLFIIDNILKINLIFKFANIKLAY